jgi:hypothetical protein
MRMRLGFAVAAVSVAGAAILASWPSPCPIELKMVSVQPAEIINESGEMFCLVTLSVHNPKSVGLQFENNQMIFEARVSNHWVEASNHWTLGLLRAGNTREVLVLIEPGADACRFRLRYSYWPTGLPFGIGDTWAREMPPSQLSAQVQHVARRLSVTLYDRLWPPRESWVRSPHWRVGWTRVCNVSPAGATLEQTLPADKR